MSPSLSLPPRLSKHEAAALASNRLGWSGRFFVAGLVTMGACPVICVCMVAGAVFAGWLDL